MIRSAVVSRLVNLSGLTYKYFIKQEEKNIN